MAVVGLVLTAAPSGAAPPVPGGGDNGGGKALPWFATHNPAHKGLQSGGVSTFRFGEGEGGESSDEIMEQADQFAEARFAPGLVNPGAYTAAFGQLRSLPVVGHGWTSETRVPYNSDDPRYRDFFSNSSGGAGKVSGRITGLAADDNGYVYGGAADGGVFRSRTGGGAWTPIADRLPTLSTGDLRLDRQGRLWYATGEANTGGTSYVGAGVFVLKDPRRGTFSPRDRVGGTELESTVIRKVRFIGDTAWVATNRGVWTHSISNLGGAWKLEFAPNPAFLPGGASANDPNAPYKNITNDVAANPRDPSQVVLAIGWRSGDTYNGFYAKRGGSWQRVTLGGDIASDAANVGMVTFAFAANGSKAYAIEQSPEKLATDPDTALQGVFKSESGSVFGPWTKVADAAKLSASGSALNEPGFRPGVQAWYNQFLQVDPADANHVWMGLEEVFETGTAGATWSAVGPYWNFTFPCWNNDADKQTGNCSQSTHPDQHSIAVGRSHGRSYVVIGDDGGMYRRPVRGSVDSLGHATDWVSLNDGTIDALQYYSVGVGRDGHGVAISGGLQDNGQSIRRAGERRMGSNFGGDGGDTFVDPNNGCNIAEEYVTLNMRITNNCAVNGGDAQLDPAKATSYDVAPPDAAAGLARFIAPFTADPKNINTWVAGGQHVWVQDKGFAIRSGAEWRSVFDLGAGHTATAVSTVNGVAYVGWCGPCNNQGFTRGIAVGHTDGTGWHQLTLPVDGTIPNRFVSGFDVDPRDANHVYVAINGFSRRFTEGPGAGIGHLFESRNAGATWQDISTNLPDVPADSVRILPGGGLALATDLGVLVRLPGRTNWAVLGRDLPTTTVMQIKIHDGTLYAATHGRGIWSYRF